MRTSPPKRLKAITPVEATASYDPSVTSELTGAQRITVYLPPLWIMSPGIRVYRARDVIPFDGYLSSFEPANVDDAESPVTVMTLTVER